MSLDYNPLAEFGFGSTGTTQTWQTVIDHIKDKCGVIGQFERSDEAIIHTIKTQILPFYSIYDGYPQYCRLTSADVISQNPTRVYSTSKIKQLISVRNIMMSEYLYLGNLGEDTLMGYGGTTTEDFLISRNWADINKLILPERSWKFIPPARLELIDLAGLTMIYDMVVEFNTVHPDPSSINPTMFEFFKDMCAGYMMMTIGTIRTKIDGLSTPTGTINTNGQQLKQDGETLLRETKDKLILTPPDTMLYLW